MKIGLFQGKSERHTVLFAASILSPGPPGEGERDGGDHVGPCEPIGWVLFFNHFLWVS